MENDNLFSPSKVYVRWICVACGLFEHGVRVRDPTVSDPAFNCTDTGDVLVATLISATPNGCETIILVESGATLMNPTSTCIGLPEGMAFVTDLISHTFGLAVARMLSVSE